MQLTVHRLQLPRKLQRALVFGIVLATCCLWIQVFLRKRVVNPIAGNKWSLDTDLENIIHKCPPINLAIYAREEPNLMQFYTLLKNILYYQGRKKMNNSGCLLSVQTVSNRGCPTVKLPPPNPLLLHLVVDEESRLNITRTFNDWKLVNLYVIFYEYKRYKSLVEPYGGSKSIGEAGMIKLLWPEIIKVPTTKIILLDTDMLFNRNIIELWNMFDDFKSTQMIGGVFEQTYYRKGLITSPGFPILKSGINTGMLLLHIERMRKMKWSELWRNTTKILLAKATMMSTGDQAVFNQILYRNPTYLYEIPCEWNYVLFGNPNPVRCPIVWMFKLFDKENCLLGATSQTRELRLAGLVHFVSQLKPEELDQPDHQNLRPVSRIKIFSMEEMQRTFKEVYYAFRKLSFKCFL